MKKKLSVVIPTLNRLELLKITLHHILPQVERNLSKVEFIISINSSNDDTYDHIKKLSKKKTFIKCKNFENRVEPCESFSRSIDLCSGDYIIIYGDDDIPAPYLIENILNILEVNENVALIHFNRIIGHDTKEKCLTNLKLEDTNYKVPELIYNLSDFISHYTISPGFISSMVFKRETWELGKAIENSNHYGYEYLSRVYLGIHKLESAVCIYSSFPAMIQRMIQKREWNEMWPKYWFIGVPNLLNSLDDEKITFNVIKKWHEKLDKSNIKFIYYLIWASSFKKKYKSLISIIMKHQKKMYRKFLVVIIINLTPSFVFTVIRKFIYRK
jgi:glycosyltransferase involved in cell wall biosynthesis